MDYKKILVVVDPTSDVQPALARAAELAHRSQASITAFLSIFDLSYEMTSILSSQEREAMRLGVINQCQAWLADLLKPYLDKGLPIEHQVLWHNRPYESIIKFTQEGGFDLIVKSTHQHDKLKAVIFTPTDWHLLRKSPVPVLLVKEKEWPVQGNMLCAVNVACEDEAHLTLNSKIIEHANALAQRFDAKVHLVNGYPGTPVNLAIELPDFDARSYNEAIQSQHVHRVNELASQYQIESQHCHVQQGLPEDVIPEVAEQLNAELVVLGTVGRTGLSAALIGNTAEHVIDSINCDLLAIKPDGYKSPIG